MSRAAILSTLAAFVAAVGVVAWLGPGNGLHSLTSGAPAAPTPRPHVQCVLALHGAVDDCAMPVAGAGANPACTAVGNVLQAVVHLRGNARDYVLYIEMIGWYHGPSTYPLWPWGHTSLTAADVPKVALRFERGATWESSDGSVTVAADGRSGTLNARLGYTGGLSAAPLGVLSLTGRWSCV